MITCTRGQKLLPFQLSSVVFQSGKYSEHYLANDLANTANVDDITTICKTNLIIIGL